MVGKLPKNKDLKIESVDDDTNWVNGTFKGHCFTAKIFTDSSSFGINNGRVSKLQILKDEKPGENGWMLDDATTLFNYDRGMDMDNPIGHEFAELIDGVS